MKNLTLLRCILTFDKSFPLRVPGQSIFFTLISFYTLMTESDNTDRYIMSHTEPHTGKGLFSRNEKESPPQWDSSGEAKSSSGNINSSASVRGTCWFNAFLSPGEQSSIINDLVLMPNDNTVWCTTINARICRLETDFDYHWHVLFLQKKDKLASTAAVQQEEEEVICLLQSLCLFKLISIITEAFSPFLFPALRQNWSFQTNRLMCNSTNSSQASDSAEKILM